MRTARIVNGEAPTTAQSLARLLKSARDIMRKDKGLNGDLDRLPMLTWIMFLKFLDDMDVQREQEAMLAGGRFRPLIDPPYRWRDWASRADGTTGTELLSFINSEECTRPDGTRGPGLFAYLRGLSNSNGDDRREVVATVFRGVENRMKSGYLLRDVINKIHGIHFTSSQELQTLGALYEIMLREMRDAAGDSGEFYTPRPLVRFMVEAVDPRLGETVLDPACGTGGFLVEAFVYLSKQVKTVADRRVLQAQSLFGFEPKPLPYLLSQMNLLLHGLDAPQIDPGNALRFKLTEIGEKDRVDIILTNPPFGGEEEKGIQGNFPEDRRTAETALLFLQLIMRRLRRTPKAGLGPARAAVVVPNGTLFGGGICARIKEELLTEFNLHTIVRLPNGVFAPYTPIATNVLFFDRSGPTKEVWYYEHPLPEGRKNYTKTQPLQFEEFGPCLKWWNEREEGDHAWCVPADDLLTSECNLDRKNPRGRLGFEHLSPRTLVDDVMEKERRMAVEISEIKAALRTPQVNSGWPDVQLGEVLTVVKRSEVPLPGTSYRQLGVKLWGEGAYEREPIDGGSTKYSTFFRVETNDVVVNKIWARNGSVAVIPETLSGCYVSSEFPTFSVNARRLLPRWMHWLTKTPSFWAQCDAKARGTSGKNRIRPAQFLKVEIPLPSPEEQKRIIARIDQLDMVKRLQTETSAQLDALLRTILDKTFQGEPIL